MSLLFEKINSHHSGLIPSKVARKYKLLSENLFRFFRGTNNLFYEDLGQKIIPRSPVCWICGDLHIENFGSYKGDNRLVYFDLNDFDEGLLAPASFEAARMLASIFIAFDNLNIEAEKALKMTHLFLK